ncbi:MULTISPECIES: hypothetical protein [unclassified Pseudomonas]|uniref:hypothetical protein n=1 Tax=unclassified Pseudomonas TaxID=196821 RepID=UPI00244CA524|nr:MULTISPECIES: hypothetical protein [unclassified Pseudomonas]MDH0894997.1 hypothetical protein [Pseudomonas sp. GD03875]MDH1065376.1 hypothetical protein [Pseudomonas sp. GD03985]
MSALNPMTASLFGVLAAAYWAILFLRKLYRNKNNFGISRNKKIASAAIAAIIFPLALFIAYYLSFPIGSIFLRPGPAIHIVMSLNIALCVSIIGAMLTIATGYVSLYILKKESIGS